MVLPASAAKAISPKMPDITHRVARGTEIFVFLLTFNNPGGTKVDTRVMEFGAPAETMLPWRSMDKTLSAICASIWEKNLIHAVKTKTPQEAVITFRGGEVTVI